MTGNGVRKWLSEHFPGVICKEEWPPNSPDLNLMDFRVWGRLKELINSETFGSAGELKVALKREWDALNQEEINRAADDFPKRLDAVIRVDGGHFE